MFNVESLERAELGESLLTWVSARRAGAWAAALAPAPAPDLAPASAAAFLR